MAVVDAAGKGNVVFTETVFPELSEDEPPETRLARVQPSGKVRTIASLSDYEAQVNPEAGQQYGLSTWAPSTWRSCRRTRSLFGDCRVQSLCGEVYVAELFGFAISRVVGGVLEPHAEAPFPSALEIDRDGTLYAAIGAFFDEPPFGSVVRVLP